MDRQAFSDAALEIGLSLSGDQIEAFSGFEDALYKANLITNLTRVSREECWSRHFIDSLLVHSLLPRGASVLDIGTGPGFPAWPLASARPDLQVTAMDSNAKTLAFLVRHILPNLKIINARAEEWPRSESFDVVTGRALAPLPIQLELSARPCRIGGKVIPLRTTNDEGMEPAAAGGLGLKFIRSVRMQIDALKSERVFPIYEKVAPTAAQYPRAWARIKSRPLPSSGEPL